MRQRVYSAAIGLVLGMHCGPGTAHYATEKVPSGTKECVGRVAAAFRLGDIDTISQFVEKGALFEYGPLGIRLRERVAVLAELRTGREQRRILPQTKPLLAAFRGRLATVTKGPDGRYQIAVFPSRETQGSPAFNYETGAFVYVVYAHATGRGDDACGIDQFSVVLAPSI